MSENLHEGHRKRLREKFKKSANSFNEHEILELLLGYAIARKDTNELAHVLIKTFGSLDGVLSASVESLMKVKGVGEHTATLLSVTGYASSLKKHKTVAKTLSNIDAVKSFTISLFENLDHEVMYMVYLDGNKKVLGYSTVDSGKVNRVDIDFDVFSAGISTYKPKCVIIAHNHFAKYPAPSEQDDKATALIYAFLNFHKISLLDHVIVSGNETYSYFYDNRLQRIKENVNGKLL